jgi:hypothetical protein
LIDFVKEIGRDPDEMRRIELIPEFTTPYFYYGLSRGHIIEIESLQRTILAMSVPICVPVTACTKLQVKYYSYPSLLRFYGEHAAEEGDYANLSGYVFVRSPSVSRCCC